jgi:hypothetical protein
VSKKKYCKSITYTLQKKNNYFQCSMYAYHRHTHIHNQLGESDSSQLHTRTIHTHEAARRGSKTKYRREEERKIGSRATSCRKTARRITRPDRHIRAARESTRRGLLFRLQLFPCRFWFGQLARLRWGLEAAGVLVANRRVAFAGNVTERSSSASLYAKGSWWA